jgi:hypothetical protein
VLLSSVRRELAVDERGRALAAYGSADLELDAAGRRGGGRAGY